MELGGAPRDPANLWPEAWPAARTKDAEENRLHDEVCRGAITLADGQARMLTYVRMTSPPGATLTGAPATTTPPVSAATTTQPSGSVYYANCTDAKAAGAAPLHRGQPGYRDALDRDHDGVACE